MTRRYHSLLHGDPSLGAVPPSTPRLALPRFYVATARGEDAVKLFSQHYHLQGTCPCLAVVRIYAAPSLKNQQILLGDTDMSAGFEDSIDSADFQLARRVRLFLASQPRPALRYLQVEASGSTVTLRGLVTTFYERQLALQCSRSVAGVRELIDEIIVQEFAPQPRADFSRVALGSVHSLAAV